MRVNSLMSNLPTDLTSEYDRLVASNDWQSVSLLLAPLVESGSPEAIYLSSMSSYPGEGSSEFEARHLRLLAEAAGKGYAPAQFTLGMYHLFGDRVPLDPGLAMSFMGPAAAHGYPPGEYEYGFALLRGMGVAKDEEEGLRLIRKAAAAGNEVALEFLREQEGLARR